MAELERIEELAGTILSTLTPGARAKLLRQIARRVQRNRRDSIGRQQAPDGTPFAPRRAKKPPTPGGYTVKFLYPKGDPNPRLVMMKSWSREGPLMTGYDIEAGGVRSFFWDKVAKWLSAEPDERTSGGGGRLRRRGAIKRKAMFAKLRLGRTLQAGATPGEAWVGFAGAAARIARIHQEGLRDRPSIRAKPVRYARRPLLDLTDADRAMMVDLALQHIAG